MTEASRDWSSKGPPRAGQTILIAAGIIVIIAGIKAAASLILPFLVSSFIALICIPPLFWMKRKGVPSGVAVLAILIVLLGVGAGLATLVGTSLNDFYRNLPAYQERLQEQMLALWAWIETRGVDVPEAAIGSVFSPGAVMQMAGRIVSGFTALLTNTFTILLTVLFFLLEATSLPAKIQAVIGDPRKSFRNFDTIVANVNRYLVIKTLVSLATGTLAGLWLAFLGIDFPVLWGLLTFLLNYIPNIGSIIAALPPVLLGIVQYGPGTALLVLIGYLVTNLTMGSFVEPRVMGKGLDLSTLVIFISLVFWNWLLGPIGMLLSVPLTMTVKIILESSDSTRWIGIFLGSGSGLPPVPAEDETPAS